MRRTIAEGAPYAITVEHAGETFYIELRCERCDETLRLIVWDDQLDDLRELARLHSDAMARVLNPTAGIEAHTRAAEIAPAVGSHVGGQGVAALIWQLTHATGHAEHDRREIARECAREG